MCSWKIERSLVGTRSKGKSIIRGKTRWERKVLSMTLFIQYSNFSLLYYLIFREMIKVCLYFAKKNRVSMKRGKKNFLEVAY